MLFRSANFPSAASFEERPVKRARYLRRVRDLHRDRHRRIVDHRREVDRFVLELEVRERAVANELNVVALRVIAVHCAEATLRDVREPITARVGIKCNRRSDALPGRVISSVSTAKGAEHFSAKTSGSADVLVSVRGCCSSDSPSSSALQR